LPTECYHIRMTCPESYPTTKIVETIAAAAVSHVHIMNRDGRVLLLLVFVNITP